MIATVNQTPLDELMELRRKHGFIPPYRKKFGKNMTWSAKQWGKKMLTEESLEPHLGSIPSLSEDERVVDGIPVTGNSHFYKAIRQRFPDFSWSYRRDLRPGVGNLERYQTNVIFYNYPTVGGLQPTLFDLLIMPVELADQNTHKSHFLQTDQRGQRAYFGEKVKIIDETGFGYKGIAGLSWLPSLEPLVLPKYLEEQLLLLGEALFNFFDAIKELYGKDEELTTMLTHKVPTHIPRLMEEGSVDIIRPDIVLVKDPETGNWRFVITELESAPGGQGMIHAIQHSYGLTLDIRDKFMESLEGRPYLVFATHEWAEYTWELAAFCKALRERGVEASILFDKPLEEIHSLVRRTWRPPPGAPRHVVASWDTDLLGRLEREGFAQFVQGASSLPDEVGEKVVFRFGYFDNFRTHTLEKMRLWQQRGAKIINPLQFPLESKALMAAIKLKSVRDWIRERVGEAHVEILDQCVAETRLLTSNLVLIDELKQDKDYWLTKYAAWDGQNLSWGARSLAVGSQNTTNEWAQSLRERLQLQFPVIAQHVISSARFDVAYVGTDDTVAIKRGCRTRYTPFLYRGPNNQVLSGGGAMTLRANTFRVHGATDAVEAPVVFQD